MPGALCVRYTAEGFLALNRNALRLGRLALGQPQLEHAIVIGRLHLLLIDHGRQHKGALEGAIGAFHAVVMVVFHLSCVCALASQGQGVLVHLNTDIILRDPGQIGREDQGAPALGSLPPLSPRVGLVEVFISGTPPEEERD
jgi:hypothetical protein